MASTDVRSVVLTLAVVVLLAAMVYTVDPTMFGLLPQMDGFDGSILPPGASNGQMPSTTDVNGPDQTTSVMGDEHSGGGDATSNKEKKLAGFKDVSGEGFADLQDVTGPAAFGDAAAPAGCYPRDQLTPGELLPQDANSVWAQQNQMGNGSLKGKNFLSAGALVGVNTVGQTLRNANWQLRSEPANPQVAVSVFNQSTIAPDTNRRDLEIS